MSFEDGTKVIKPYGKVTSHFCKYCGNDWSDYDDCYVRCNGTCGYWIERKRKYFHFSEEDEEGYYCNECYEEVVKEKDPEVKEPSNE